jgi:SWI/SNF-related matrix-associated actin-dependent regulator of chromatin subfamily A member 5
MKAIRLHSAAHERQRIKDSLRHEKFDIMLTTYESYVAEHSWFKTRRWTYCVLDEGHKIKNPETNLASKLQGLGSLYRLSKSWNRSSTNVF